MDIIYNIIGAAMEVHSELGCGFPEKVYQDALELEFKMRSIPYEREKHLQITYIGQSLEHDFFADFVCYGNIIVELKAAKEMEEVFIAQCINYLHATNWDHALLLNFGQTSLYYNKINNLSKKHKSNNK